MAVLTIGLALDVELNVVERLVSLRHALHVLAFYVRLSNKQPQRMDTKFKNKRNAWIADAR